ncbi:hypothetical protein QZH41_014067 [Actinostola sp. cb2023]|nr:hypothetical protein QZH41_014067 [Actinostola sp. cb2023]
MGVVLPCQQRKNPRMRVNHLQLDHFLSFITSPHIVQDLPFGQRYLSLSNGSTLETPNVIRMLIPQRIVAQYRQYCEEMNFTPFSESTMLRILSSCSASVRKSLQGLDYIAADGAKAFDDLIAIAQRLGDDKERAWVNHWQHALKEGKQYIKADYKVVTYDRVNETFAGNHGSYSSLCFQLLLGLPLHHEENAGVKAVLEEFDLVPLQKRLRTVQDYQKEVLALQKEEETGEDKGRRFIRWRFSQDPGEDLTQRIMTKLRKRVDTAFYLRYLYMYEIRHVEDGTVIQIHKNLGGSPWINRLAEAEAWLSHEEKKRRDPDNINRPNTKWVFVRFISSVVKVVLDRQPLMGTGPLPDWLRNLAHGRALVALDNYGDNLCLWRCIAAHRGARPERSTQAARELAKSFYELATAPKDVPKTSLDALAEVEDHLGHGSPIAGRLGIRVYEPERVPVSPEGAQII